jgi:hypothetical protein
MVHWDPVAEVAELRGRSDRCWMSSEPREGALCVVFRTWAAVDAAAAHAPAHLTGRRNGHRLQRTAHPLTTPMGRSSATRIASPARSTTFTTRSTSL